MKCNDYWKEDIISGRGDKRRAAAWDRLYYPRVPTSYAGIGSLMGFYNGGLAYSGIWPQMYAPPTKEREK